MCFRPSLPYSPALGTLRGLQTGSSVTWMTWTLQLRQPSFRPPLPPRHLQQQREGRLQLLLLLLTCWMVRGSMNWWGSSVIWGAVLPAGTTSATSRRREGGKMGCRHQGHVWQWVAYYGHIVSGSHTRGGVFLLNSPLDSQDIHALSSSLLCQPLPFPLSSFLP